MSKWQVNEDDYTVTVDLGPDCEWVAAMQWPEGVTQGGPAVLVIYPSNPESCPPGGLSQTLLRDVDFKYAAERLRRQLENSKRWDTSRKRSDKKMNDLLISHAVEGRVTDTYLALLSRAYVSAVDQGQSKPLEFLAELTSKSAASIKNHLWQATRKGLLERSPGRAGGRVTPKGAALNEAASEA
ncbi:hypothetical protein [Mycolicibacterium fortuitum]|uniref:Uncharacterized protein n=1 Tax=Mycolicibacterium fortuitum subsp. fortuitum DSM 46621 = ATCC 6841 = JCM 6387 TaxID=1214102 RepID=K0V9M6_MYCFO|nr:hypothetical protein [Mycolicibacterium fortuitum]CRL79609.1 hypothetical protein CPGR_02804 [Mycolicibacter nonchromogenicus]EJZ15792.1 hypothetical protein MFORT_02744 [Mycolicibacterium fortuitum subsp. fortuitum DSM 46621 = ATCC 6841 = JCM 6387]WEV33457.1 hypothetical protein OMF10_03300 [Mycolicibacterium fortuitum]CRL54782.1 hypothetical protein CPGR_02079 [Mycolicibacterium fortuitum subsp. fortuitum DSM 46621 = ATCC 6841 = JCM 6387]BDD96568.1 hypothetical protein MFTT_06620 [Mycolic